MKVPGAGVEVGGGGGGAAVALKLGHDSEGIAVYDKTAMMRAGIATSMARNAQNHNTTVVVCDVTSVSAPRVICLCIAIPDAGA
jgi:hypothetical protein